MKPSWRKPFGTFLLLALIMVWAVAAARAIERYPALNHPLVYIATGIVWIWLFPMKALLRWMETGQWRK
jgi:hypothetical protein